MTEKQKILEEIEDIVKLLNQPALDDMEIGNGWTDEIKKKWLDIFKEMYVYILEKKPLAKRAGYFTLGRGLDFDGIMEGEMLECIIKLSNKLYDYSKKEEKWFFLKLFGKK